MRLSFLAASTLALLMAGGNSVSYAQAHVYDLNNSYADTNGGPSLSPDGGALSSSGYSFGKDQGLNLSNAIDPSTYSIDMVFDFSNVGGYNKILDFKDLSSDSGLYVYNGFLDFYNGGQIANSPMALFAANQPLDVLFSRDGATNTVTASVNGVQQFQFIDTTGAAAFTQPGNLIRFFEDDTHTGGGESSAGVVTHISIDTAPVPEASSSVSLSVLLALGFGGYVIASRRRKTGIA